MQLRALPRSFYQAGRLCPVELSTKAKERLRLVETWEALRHRGLTSVESSQVLQAPRATIYRWQGRLRSGGPFALEEGCRAPQRRRRPTWSAHLVQSVLGLRQGFGWGKSLP